MRSDGGSNFSWIFDCGSRRTQKFDAFLCAWTDHHQQPIDWLFISHFDTDHVSGLDTLMARTVVRDVMVPYVNERELAYLLLYEIARENLSRSFIELVADPAMFFLSRGADSVTFLGGTGSPVEPIEGGVRPDHPRDGPGWQTKISPLPRQVRTPSKVGAKSGNDTKVQIVDGRKCEIVVARGPIGLRLKPYRVSMERYLHRGLIKSLHAVVGALPDKKAYPMLGKLAFAIAHHARTRAGRADLRNVFKSYVGSSNRSSMSLLSIPNVVGDSTAHWSLNRPFSHAFGRGEVAWLNTGDAELINPADVSDWKQTYVSELDSVRVLSLPHHGSDKNSDAALQRLCPQAVLAAHVKSGAKKHPGPYVSQTAGNRLACVSEEPGTEVQMRFRH